MNAFFQTLWQKHYLPIRLEVEFGFKINYLISSKIFSIACSSALLLLILDANSCPPLNSKQRPFNSNKEPILRRIISLQPLNQLPQPKGGR